MAMVVGNRIFNMAEEKENAKPSLGSKINKWKLIIQFSLDQRKIAKKAMIWLGKVIGKLLRVIKIDQLTMQIKAGSEDPAFTGSLHGFYTGIIHGLDINGHKHIKLDFEPIFNNRDIFEFEGAVSIKTSAARLLWPALVALFTFPYISALILWRRIKKMKAAMKEF